MDTNEYFNCMNCKNAILVMPFAVAKCKKDSDHHCVLDISENGETVTHGKVRDSDGTLVACTDFKLRKSGKEIEIRDDGHGYSSIDEGMKGVK